MAMVYNHLKVGAFVCLMAVTLAGCGSGSRLPAGETGTVSGKLTYKGQAVPKGTTILFMEDKSGQLASAAVDERGEYLLEMKGGLKVLCGTYRISVAAPSIGAGLSAEDAMKEAIKTKQKSSEEALKQIPARYRDPEKSKTVFEVKPGPNVFDLDMVD